MRDLARTHTERAIQTLVDALDSADERVRIAAAHLLLDRGWGRPSSEVEIHMTVAAELEGKTDAELARIAGEVVGPGDDE